MLERLPCLSGCASLTTDRETDRQVGQRLVLHSAASASVSASAVTAPFLMETDTYFNSY